MRTWKARFAKFTVLQSLLKSNSDKYYVYKYIACFNYAYKWISVKMKNPKWNLNIQFARPCLFCKWVTLDANPMMNWLEAQSNINKASTWSFAWNVLSYYQMTKLITNRYRLTLIMLPTNKTDDLPFLNPYIDLVSIQVL